MINNKYWRLIVASATIAIAPAMVFSTTKSQTKQFEKGDVDQDNQLSKKEFIELRINTAKTRAEKNSEEFDSSKVEKKSGKTFAKADVDGDGQLTIDEFLATFKAK